MPVSKGNSKMGKIPNVSLHPGKTCRSDVPCHKGCYAKKAYKVPLYTNVRRAWDENTRMALEEPAAYWTMLTDFMLHHSPKRFRWHQAGDIPNQDYLYRMAGLALMFPETEFLCFTKRYDLDYTTRPDNLTVVFSMWPGLEEPERVPGIRFAWLQDGSETRIPEDAIQCSGACDACGACWGLKQDVYFDKH